MILGRALSVGLALIINCPLSHVSFHCFAYFLVFYLLYKSASYFHPVKVSIGDDVARRVTWRAKS